MHMQAIAWDPRDLLRAFQGISDEATIDRLLVEPDKVSSDCRTFIFEGLEERWSDHIFKKEDDLVGFPWVSGKPGTAPKWIAVLDVWKHLRLGKDVCWTLAGTFAISINH